MSSTLRPWTAGERAEPTGGPVDAPDALFADRYRLRATAKSGNGIETVFAHDSVNDVDVVLKIIHPALVPPAVRIRFQHETQVLRELSGPGICMLYDAGQSGDLLYLAQPFVPGRTLEHALSDGPMSLDDTLRIGVDIAAALSIAHTAGVCHRDVKPANIIVSGTGRIEQVTLVDFGLSRSPWLDESIRDDLVGTVRYLAPEAAGALAAPADERSDLYAVGVVLFECLTGSPPFPGKTVGDLLRQHLSMAVPPLLGRDQSAGQVAGAIPRAMDDIVQRLLRKDPGERYQSAAALESDLAELAAAVARGEREPHLVVGRSDHRASLTDPSFVGREAELETLAGFVAGLAEGSAGLVLLEADSGGGKSRLLREVSRQASTTGVTVLHGQGVVNAGQRPFTVLHGVIDELVTLLRADPVAREEVVHSLADVSAALVRTVPMLAALFGQPHDDVDAGPEQFGELRTVAGFRRLLIAAASATRPILLVLDDCQWADTLTVRLLAELFPAGEPPQRLGVIAAFRSEEVEDDHPLRKIHSGRRVALGPLTATAMAQLVESMSGPLPAAITRTIVRLADGNPFMGAAVLRGIVESGALVARPDGWMVSETGLLDVQAGRRSAPFLVRRLELLSPAALHLLSVGAVLGKQFDLPTAVAIAGIGAEAGSIMADARRRRLLWVDERSARCTFFHDKIREALLERLSCDERRSLHARAADHLAQRGDDDEELVFDLAYHLDASGRHLEALPHALAGAQLSRSRYALDAAVTHYRMAERGCTDGNVIARMMVAEGLGDVLTLQGVYGEAETYLAQARYLTKDVARTAEIDGKLGELAFKQGDIPTGKRRLEGALAGLGRRVPRHGLLTVFLVWELMVQTAHTVAPRLFVGRRDAPGHHLDFLAMRLYSRLAYLYWFHSGKVSCAWSHLRGMNLAERYRPSAELGQAYSEHAPVMTMIPWYSRGIRYAQRSYQIRQELGNVWGQGQSLAFTGVVEYAASRFVASAEHCEQGIALLRQTGDQWEVNTAEWNLALCRWRLGDLGRAVEVSRTLFYSARSIGDQTAAGIALSIWARATGGRIDPELIDDQLAKASEDAQTAAELHLARALCARAQDDLPSALDSIETAVRTVSAAGLRQEYIVPVYVWAATIRREAAEAAPLHNPAQRRRLLRSARHATRCALRWARYYRNNAPHAMREAGLIASLAGRRRRAGRYLARSIELAESQGARYEAALSRVARADLLAEWGQPRRPLAIADRSLAHDQLWLLESAVRTAPSGDDEPTLSIFDRFTSLLHAGHAITASASYPALESAIREAVTSLLRAERCHLVPVDALDQEQLTTRSGEDLYDLSRSLLTRAVAEGAPVVAMEQAADSNDSLLLSGIRSAIAAPILVAGEATTCLYATHRQLGQLFGDDEIQLAAFIATLAGAALEHLAGSETRFRSLAEQLKEKNVELERAGRAKDMFLASMSHELRTPLNAIIGFTGTLLMELPGPLNPEQTRQLHTVQTSGHHLLSIINDLLDLAKIESGAVELSLEDVDCVDVTRTVVSSLQPLADVKELPLILRLPETGLVARSDSRALGQILINLVNNAIAFTTAGEVCVEVHTGPAARPRISVRDTGPGIGAQDLDRIFNAFERGGHGRNRADGTGLGLHICRKLSELIGAELSVESTVGVGSTFTVELQGSER
ncbi:MAG TPA: ATP-binding protein [Jatrophihabitantaceae bacterium]